jgi:hypothetical protein
MAITSIASLAIAISGARHGAVHLPTKSPKVYINLSEEFAHSRLAILVLFSGPFASFRERAAAKRLATVIQARLATA